MNDPLLDKQFVGEDQMLGTEDEVNPAMKDLETDIIQAMGNQNSLDELLSLGASYPESSSMTDEPSTETGSLFFGFGGNSESSESYTMESFTESVLDDDFDFVGDQKRCCCFSTSPPQESKDETESKDENQPEPEEPTMTSPVLPIPAREDMDKICLVLDMDETLIHSSFLPVPNQMSTLPHRQRLPSPAFPEMSLKLLPPRCTNADKPAAWTILRPDRRR